MNNSFALTPPPSLYRSEPEQTIAPLNLPPQEHQQTAPAKVDPDSSASHIASALNSLIEYRKGYDQPTLLKRQEVAHTLPLGPVKTIFLGKHWQENQFASKIYRRNQFEIVGDSSTRLTVRLSRLALSEKTRRHLISVVEQGRFRPNNHILFADSIDKLSEFFGSATIGRNQYTCPTDKGNNGQQDKLFHFDAATLIWVKGQATILVEGKFQDESGHPTRHFVGAFIPYETERGTMVMELALTAATREAYLLHKTELKQVLTTLVPAA
ncbi:MAG: hypothetical protein HC888_13625 [Candidatus Competibacteraceae bacterium]|nr:hypothetical protein [Candidatus Competibacteraceae bacterium]